MSLTQQEPVGCPLFFPDGSYTAVTAVAGPASIQHSEHLGAGELMKHMKPPTGPW